MLNIWYANDLPYGPRPIWARAHMGQGPYEPRPIWARAHMSQGPYGPRPIWAKAHMGEGPYGPRPIWAWAHMGQRPYGPRPYGPRPIWARAHMGPGPLGPGPFLVGQTPHQKTHPGKKSPNCVFFVVFLETKKMRGVRTIIFHQFSRRDLCCVSENEGFRFAKNQLTHADPTFIAHRSRAHFCFMKFIPINVLIPSSS